MALPSLGELLQVFLKVCDGVAFAHSRGVVHRDLKPDNIMVGDFGEVLVMDWGLAKVVGREDIRAADLVTSSRLESTSTLTADGSALGTPAYMSPEQADGELEKIDHRSDIYSLGAILYEMLTLERPVEGEARLAVLMNVVKGKIVPPEKRTPARHIPRELSAVAMKCLSKSRLRRYQSVSELRKDVSLFLEGRSVSAAPDTFAQAFVKLVKRNRGVSAAIAAAAAIIIVLTTFFVVNLKRERDEAVAARRIAEKQRQETQDARTSERATALAASERFAMQAIRAAESGNWDEAQRRAKDAHEVAVHSPWGFYARGVFARIKNDHKAAADCFREALRAAPRHPESKAALSEVLAKMGRLREAEKHLADLGSITEWRTLLKVGEALHDAGRWEDCLVPLRRAAQLMEDQKDVAVYQRDRVAKHVHTMLETATYELETARAHAACEGFADQIRYLTPQEQAKRVEAKVAEIHGERISLRPHFEGGKWTVAVIRAKRFSQLLPLKGLHLRKLTITSTRVQDLSPLRGMPLAELNCAGTGVADLRPLAGMPLTCLRCAGTGVGDLSPLKGMPLTYLDCRDIAVTHFRQFLRLREDAI